MPEGPSILLMKENLVKFVRKKVTAVEGNAKIDKILLKGKVLREVRTFGKQTYLVFDKISVRIHLLMFGSYSINETTKPDSRLRLGLYFKTGAMFFYTCSVKLVDNTSLAEIDWDADVLSDKWDPGRAMEKLKSQAGSQVCDVLLDQHIFSGVGNIIKNEVLFRIGVQPESLAGHLPPQKLNELIAEARNYSFDFLKWKRAFVLKKHWLVHNKVSCPCCGSRLIKKITGKAKRRSFYCETDQKIY
ncbi:DNA-formamidopyrimidine glycosylase family protein [Niabella aquatica]